MSDKTLQDLKVDAHIAVLHTKVDALIEKQKEITGRVRANEKVVAAIGLLGSIALAFIGAGYFAPKAEAAPSANEWIQRMREWKSEQDRTPIDDSINNALLELEIDYGSDDTTEQKELLQFPSDGDQSSAGRRYDRCHHRSWIRFIQERTGKSCGSRHTGETYS
jgi:hypothetical protein